MAKAFYDKKHWEKASDAFEKAINVGCGRHPEAMRDYFHVKFMLWNMSESDPELHKVGSLISFLVSLSLIL
jgi:hypothetical protein